MPKLNTSDPRHPTGDPGWPFTVIACPPCRGDLVFEDKTVGCGDCGAVFPQNATGLVDLMPAGFVDRDATRWSSRQDDCYDWYRELLADRDRTCRQFRDDYASLPDELRRYGGRVVDIGGGCGVARHVLAPECEYLVVEPDARWRDPDWNCLSSAFPCMKEPAEFVRGVAERLPLHDHSFDAALMLWSLNHASRPKEAVREAARVLKTGGRLFVALEETPPTWTDLLRFRYPSANGTAAALRAKVVSLWKGWPTQPDHLPITCRMLRTWAAPDFELSRREWLAVRAGGSVDPFLTFEFVRR